MIFRFSSRWNITFI